MDGEFENIASIHTSPRKLHIDPREDQGALRDLYKTESIHTSARKLHPREVRSREERSREDVGVREERSERLHKNVRENKSRFEEHVDEWADHVDSPVLPVARKLLRSLDNDIDSQSGDDSPRRTSPNNLQTHR